LESNKFAHIAWVHTPAQHMSLSLKCGVGTAKVIMGLQLMKYFTVLLIINQEYNDYKCTVCRCLYSIWGAEESLSQLLARIAQGFTVHSHIH